MHEIILKMEHAAEWTNRQTQLSHYAFIHSMHCAEPTCIVVHNMAVH
jgi:hypothetical protein